jgi:hypothetical protein
MGKMIDEWVIKLQNPKKDQTCLTDVGIGQFAMPFILAGCYGCVNCTPDLGN